MTTEEIKALYAQFLKDSEEETTDGDAMGHMYALARAIEREREKHQSESSAITMRPFEAAPLIDQFYEDIKAAGGSWSPTRLTISGAEAEVALTRAIERERLRCATIARNFRANEAADDHTPGEIADEIMGGAE